MPKVTINGQTVEVAEGTTVIEAFKKIDQDIAHYCWHPGLTIAGVCRLCMVEVEGNPRLQIACNTVVQDGMVVSNQSEKVKDTVKWGLDFHLINHPLDCPICDQAGECGLQDQYMQFGKYTPEMAERKVKKRKVVDLGPKIVLDSERCILCSRCVRFTDEVSKTNELGIFNRGDRSEIGTFEDKPLDNDYSVNTVDICPVGALTSKDFRFRQRVWYLKNKESICPGCSTGCNVRVYYNEEGLFRVKPEHNDEVNGYWMCDKGRDTYKFVNKEFRLTQPKIGHRDQWKLESPAEMAKQVHTTMNNGSTDKVGLVVTGQYTSEEYRELFQYFTGEVKSKKVYHWINNPDQMEDFDGLLLRGDRNPNTKGLLSLMSEFKLTKTWTELKSDIEGGQIETLIVLGPENPAVFPDLNDNIRLMSQVKSLIWLTADHLEALDEVGTNTIQVPMKTYFEKSGTFVNFAGKEQKLSNPITVVPEAIDVIQFVEAMKTGELHVNEESYSSQWRKSNFFVNQRGQL